MSKWIASICMFGISLAQAEPVILDWGALLGSIAKDPTLQASNDRITLLQKSPGIGYWDDLELRYSMDGLDLREHKVDLRMTPYGWGERKAYQSVNDSRLKKTQAEKDRALSDALYDRYVLAVEWIYRSHQLAQHQALLQVYQDRVHVHNSLSGTDRFDPRDMVESQEMIVDIEGRILSDRNDIQEIEQALHSLVDDWVTVQLDTVGMLNAIELRARLEKFPEHVDENFPEYKVATEALKKVQREQELVRASHRNVISYAQVGYAWQFPEAGKRDKTTPIEDMSVGLGIRIPFGDGGDQDRFDAEVDVLDEKATLVELQWKLAKDVNKMNRQIGSLLRQMEVRDAFVKKVDAGSLFADYAMRAGSDPLLLLKSRATALETAWDSEQLLFDAYLLYLDILKKTGVLAKDPGTNHLHRATVP